VNILIVERDNRIIREWFEPYKYGTIKQIEKAFFREQQYSYEIARKRLLEMGKAGLIKIFKDVTTNRNIYVINYKETSKRIKAPTLHTIITLDVLAEMLYNGFTIEEFTTNKEWLGGKVKSDGFVIFTIKNRRYHFFIETQYGRPDTNLKKYDYLYESREVQNYLGKNHFPRILLIDDRQHRNIDVKYTQVVQLDTKLNQFPSILL